MIEITCKLITAVFFINIVVCDKDEKYVNKTSKMEGFIVGGSDATIDKYPHSVFLTIQCVSNVNEYWVCGASILNQRLLLTAGHCLYGCIGKLLIDAIAGTTNVERANVMRRVRRYVYHGKYDPETDYCDVAVSLIHGYFPLGKTIKRVIIRRNFPYEVKGEVAGWGVINAQNVETTKLKRVIQHVKPVQACRHMKMMPGMMCVSSNTKHDYPAVGDSGSALVTSPGRQQVGIVSFKSRSIKINMIVYTNVSHYYSWIILQSNRLWCTRPRLLF